jgi:hypothetical protein
MHSHRRPNPTRVQSGIAELMRNAGFAEARRVSTASTLIGTLAFYEAA